MYPFADRAIVTQVAEPDAVEPHADLRPTGNILQPLQPFLEGLLTGVSNVILDFVWEYLQKL